MIRNVHHENDHGLRHDVRDHCDRDPHDHDHDGAHGRDHRDYDHYRVCPSNCRETCYCGQFDRREYLASSRRNGGETRAIGSSSFARRHSSTY